MPSKKDGFTQSRGSRQQKKLPLPSITKFIYLVMRSIFCRRAWWKVGCPDRVSSHIDSSWKKCRSSQWLKLSQGVRLTVFCAGDGWGNWKKSLTSNTWACYQSNQKQPNSSVHCVKSETHSCLGGFKCQRVTVLLIKIPNVSQGPGSLRFSGISARLLSPYHPNFEPATRTHRGKPETIELQVSEAEMHSLEMRWEAGARQPGVQREKITKTMIMAVNCAADTSSCPRTP